MGLDGVGCGAGQFLVFGLISGNRVHVRDLRARYGELAAIGEVNDKDGRIFIGRLTNLAFDAATGLEFQDVGAR